MSIKPDSPLIPIPRQTECLRPVNAPPEGPVEAVIDPSLSELGAEGYTLVSHQEGWRLEAATKQGLYYAQQTFAQLKSMPVIPSCGFTDSPAMKMRGVMFDLARLKERHDYYYEMIDLLSQWKINTVFLHLTDHSGCAIEFDCFPNLATPFAFTKQEMRDLIAFAAARHVELIPEMETWGHAKWITRLPELADLAEDTADPRALCTLNPRTWEVLAHILDETAELFPSKYLHAGCDEADFGKCPKCTAMVEEQGPGALVGEHVRRVCELVKERGKVPMVWGDILLRHRESVDYVPKDSIIAHWDYAADLSPEPVEFVKDLGYTVVGCPAVVWGSRMVLPRADTLDNVSKFAQIALDNDCLGMETTVWVPQRYISDTLYFGLAHAAELSWSGPVRSRLDFAKGFAQYFYGLPGTDEIARMLIDVHSLSEKSFDKMMNPWAYTRELRKADLDTLVPDLKQRRDAACAMAQDLKRARVNVTRHLTEYDSVVLSAELLSYIQERALALIEVLSSLPEARKLMETGNNDAGRRLAEHSASQLREIAARGDALTTQLEATWDHRRYPDDPMKHAGGENLLGAFLRARTFFAVVIERLSAARSAGELELSAVFAQPEAS